MSSDEPGFIHPDDVSSIRELRGDPSDAFLACKRRYTLRGLDEEESRENACAYARSVLKKVTLDIDPDVEKASVKELWNYLIKQKPKVLWTLTLVLIALIAGAFSLGVFVGSQRNASQSTAPPVNSAPP